MEQHFCSCQDLACPHNPRNPQNQSKNCDACMRKVLELGEVPACIWNNLPNGLNSASQWSAGNFARFFLEQEKHQSSAKQD